MVKTLPAFKAAVLNGAVRSDITISVFKQSGQITITNGQIVFESMKVEQAICDGESLRFGGCISGAFEIDLICAEDLTGEYITVFCGQTARMTTYPGEHLHPHSSVYPSESVFSHEFPIFSGEVYSCRRSKNRLTRHLVAYDRFYWRGNRDCKDLYDDLFTNNSTVTLGMLRRAILREYIIYEADPDDPGGTQHIDPAESVPLPADDFVIHKMDTDSLTVSDVLRMIGEFNGVFLFLNGAGNIVYADCGVNSGAVAEEYDYYIEAEAEDYECSDFDAIHVYGIGFFRFSGDDYENAYDMDNAVVTAGYHETPPLRFIEAFNDVKDDIAPNFSIEYVPIELSAQTRLWIQPGDKICVNLRWYANRNSGYFAQITPTQSIVMSRRITGIHAMRDSISARGEKA